MRNWLYEVLSEADCIPEIFWKNVGDNEIEVREAISLAESKEEVEEIVNEYI